MIDIRLKYIYDNDIRNFQWGIKDDVGGGDCLDKGDK
jgi:hypothetical protein